MGRTPCCDKQGLNKGRWTREEDERLINYIQQHGEGSWRSLPNNAGLQRCGKSCRLRWINYLRSDLKRGNFTAEEEETIVKLHTSVGNRWSLIASQLPGRTDNEIKNYWNSHLSRRIYSFRFITSGPTPPLADDVAAKMATPLRRRGGRVSRSVAKKYSATSFHVATASFPNHNKCKSVIHQPGPPESDGKSLGPAGPTKVLDESYVVLPFRETTFAHGVHEDAGGILNNCGGGENEGYGGQNATAGGMYTFQMPAAGGSSVFDEEDEEWVNWILDDDDDAFRGYDEFWEGVDDMLPWPWDDKTNTPT